MKKIMFNDKYGLTKAVLNGRKTQTRRVITNDVALCHACTRYESLAINYAAYYVGEVVAVAQKYFDLYHAYKPSETAETFWRQNGSAGWWNKMFVKAELMPHHIRITNIRIERLQDISYEECLEEGIHRTKFGDSISYYFERGKNFYSARDAYATLIDKVSGKGTWDSNPWVFVYDFELVD